jgi:hypothetical protein
MIRKVEPCIDGHCRIQMLEPIHVAGPRRALVTILEIEAAAFEHETALLSEAALAKDWNRSEEDAAWSHFELGK